LEIFGLSKHHPILVVAERLIPWMEHLYNIIYQKSVMGNGIIGKQRVNQLQLVPYHCSAILDPCDWYTPKESSWNQE
jgi:hypothetical protein